MNTLPENITLAEYLSLLQETPKRSYKESFYAAQQRAQLISIWEHLEYCYTLPSYDAD